MQFKTLRHFLFFLLAIVFSIALMFAFIEIPALVDKLLQERFGFPGMDHGADESSNYLANIYIDALYLRWIGYASLVIIIFFIILGFVTKKSGWAWAGAFTIFLPVFGQFAYSMFFLSGLGILRTGWLPFMDISWNVLDLGNVIYVPYRILLWFLNRFGWYAHDFISWLFMALGAFIFVWGLMEWFSTRFGRKGVAIRSIYKISRHPQYLGWILWSYGFMLFSAPHNDMKKSWGVSTSLPWLLMTMIIIAICLLEELKMEEIHGKEYEEYRNKTPFLLPLPRWMKGLIRQPARLILKQKAPATKTDILKVTGAYTLLLILASMIWVDFTPANQNNPEISPVGILLADSVLTEINKPGQGRRDYIRHIQKIEAFGDNAIPVLIQLIGHPIPEVREFAVYSLGHLKAEGTGEDLIDLVADENGRVRNAAIQTLGILRTKKAGPILAQALADPAYDGFRQSLYHALANIQAEEAIPLLIEGTERPPWYQQIAAMNSLFQIDPDTCFPLVYAALRNEDLQVRRNAVILLLRDPREESLEPLRGVTGDEDFETRFYARQAIRLIESQDK